MVTRESASNTNGCGNHNEGIRLEQPSDRTALVSDYTFCDGHWPSDPTPKTAPGDDLFWHDSRIQFVEHPLKLTAALGETNCGEKMTEEIRNHFET